MDKIDEERFSVINDKGDRVELFKDYLSPQIDPKGAEMKKLLTNLESHTMDSFINKLNETLSTINKLAVPCGSKKYESNIATYEESSMDTISESWTDTMFSSDPHKRKSLEEKQDEERILTGGAEFGTQRSLQDSSTATESDTQSFDEENTEDEENVRDKVGDNESYVDIESKLIDIIAAAEYCNIELGDMEVPAHIKIDAQRVKQLKEALRMPDRTQTWVGAIRQLDRSGQPKGSLEVWVNPELYEAIKEVA